MRKPDLARLWEEHTAYEFSTRDAEATLATMVDDAHVNHVPVFGSETARKVAGPEFDLKS